jgi:hypothetical protein
VTYARPLFDLQVEFAEAVAALSGLPLARALLDYTNLYIRFGLGRGFDPAHPGWQEYLTGLRDARDARDWTYHFYTSRPDPGAAPDLVATFGCFSYARPSPDQVRLHFHNAEPDGRSPLAAEARGRRLAELAALFAHVRATGPASARVVGASWLYHLTAYRRLFPASYLATARALGDRFRHLPLWGQFVDRHGQLRAAAVAQFRERLGRQSGPDGLDRCFPLSVLSVAAPVGAFYEFHRL